LTTPAAGAGPVSPSSPPAIVQPPTTSAPPSQSIPSPTRTFDPSPHPSPTPNSGPDLSAYRGLGTWIDVYDQSDVFGPRAFGDPAHSVRDMVRHGVRTVFLEAGSYRHPPVSFPATTARYIDAAHAAGLRVVAW